MCLWYCCYRSHGCHQSRADVPEYKVQGRAAGGRGLQADDGVQKVISVLSAPSGWGDLPPGGVPLRRSFLSPSLLTGPGGRNKWGLKDTAVVLQEVKWQGGSSKGCADDKATRRLSSFPLFWPWHNLRLLLLLLLLSVVQTCSCLGSSAGVRDR